MKRKITLLFILLTTICLSLSASWHIGIESGYVYSMVNTRTGWSNTDITNSDGFDVTIPVEYKVNNWFSINSGIRFAMKSSNYKKVATIFVSEPLVIADYKRMHYVLDFPLTLRFSAGNETFSAFLGGGAYLGVRLFDQLSGVVTDTNYKEIGINQIQGLSSDANYFDAGAIAECGFTVSPSDFGYLYFLFRYQYGFTSLSKNYKLASHTYFDNVCFSLGYMFNL